MNLRTANTRRKRRRRKAIELLKFAIDASRRFEAAIKAEMKAH
jgi:hypothetical protein